MSFKKCIDRLCNIKNKCDHHENLDIIEYKTETKIKDYECIICLEPFFKNETITIIKCGHMYHTSCIYTWFLTKPVCPLCDEILDIK